jgi:hypothetical protein
MTQQTINIGTAANDRTGDPLRTAFSKINANFTELYAGGANETQLTNGAYTLTLGSNGNLTFPDATQQTTAALLYVKTAYNATNGTATLDFITATITNTGGGHVRIYYTTTSVSNITLQYSVMNIGSAGGNGGASFSQNSSSAPFNFGNIDNLGDMQIAYIQDMTNHKIYRITGINTYGTVGTTTAYGSILIERII